MSLEKITAKLRVIYPEMSQAKANDIVSAVALSMSETLIEEGSLQLRGFASFKIAPKKGKRINLPQGGQVVTADSLTVKYTPAKAVLEAIN